jgi:hypothetical protein
MTIGTMVVNTALTLIVYFLLVCGLHMFDVHVGSPWSYVIAIGIFLTLLLLRPSRPKNQVNNDLFPG